MRRGVRVLLTVAVVGVVLVIGAGLVLPLLLNTAGTRARIESALSAKLGRQVTLGATTLSVWSGSLVARDARVADDPAFGPRPFLEARSMRIGVEVLPYLLRREVHVRYFALDTPRVRLLRSTRGTWNYASLSRSANRFATGATPDRSPEYSVSELAISHGQITVSLGGEPARVYEDVDLRLKNFAWMHSFPFKVTAKLPGEGTASLEGTAGPIQRPDASAMPFSGHFLLKHVALPAAGLLPVFDGVSGLVDRLELDASWSGKQIHVTRLLVDGPHLTAARLDRPKPAATAQAQQRPDFLARLTVENAEVRNGAVTITTPGRAGAPVVYKSIDAQITGLTPGSPAPFHLAAQTPGGGSLRASGKAGPFGQPRQAQVDARVTFEHVRLATVGVLPADAGVDGSLNLQAQVSTSGQTLCASGKGEMAGIKLSRNGTASLKPLDVQFTITEDEALKTGVVQGATLSVGAAVVKVSGGYGLSGPATTVNLKVNGDAVPIDAMEAFLPAMGVRLPQGSRLQGGTLTASLAITGTTAAPVIAGPVALKETQLAGFDLEQKLGQKLGALSKLTGGQVGVATGPGTAIRSLRMDIRDTSEGLSTDRIALDVQGLGTATGDGTVSKEGALHYNMLVKLTEWRGGPAQAAGGGLGGLLASSGWLGNLAGSVLRHGIPVEVRGTTASPTFLANLGGLALGTDTDAGGTSGAWKGGKQGASGPQQQLQRALGRLLGKH